METNGLKITDLLDLNETIAASIFDGFTFAITHAGDKKETAE